MEFIRERRSIRKFDHTKLVDKATMETLVEAARVAPTAMNRQKLIFHPIICTPHITLTTDTHQHKR